MVLISVDNGLFAGDSNANKSQSLNISLGFTEMFTLEFRLGIAIALFPFSLKHFSASSIIISKYDALQCNVGFVRP